MMKPMVIAAGKMNIMNEKRMNESNMQKKVATFYVKRLYADYPSCRSTMEEI